jgi:hypothetical protein
VLAGEGVPTRKLDGASCLVRDGKLYKRRELRKGDPAPPSFEAIDHDEEAGKTVGWVPVGDGPEDRYHREGFAFLMRMDGGAKDGTYELVGPKIQGNPEGLPEHQLVPHSSLFIHLLAENTPPRTFDALREWMAGQDIEGVVWHHPDGRMAKLKLRDFGLKRPKMAS